MVNSKLRTLSGSRKRFYLLLAAFAMAVALWALPTTSSAWLSWSGADPVLHLSNGHSVAIVVEVPPENACDLQGIEVNITLPDGVSATSVDNPSVNFGCGSIQPETTVSNTSKASKSEVTHVGVSVVVTSDTSHRIRVTASVDGGDSKLVASGKSNKATKGTVVVN